MSALERLRNNLPKVRLVMRHGGQDEAEGVRLLHPIRTPADSTFSFARGLRSMLEKVEHPRIKKYPTSVTLARGLRSISLRLRQLRKPGQGGCQIVHGGANLQGPD